MMHAEQPNNPMYHAVLELAKIQLDTAFDSFKRDARIPWREIPGDMPRVQHRVWADALKETLKHHEELLRLS